MQTETDAAGASSLQSASTEKVPVKVTQKMHARAAYEAQLKTSAADGEEEDEGLEVFDEDSKDDDEEEDVEMDVGEVTQSKGKGKGRASESALTQQEEETGARSACSKRRRPVLDPFAGAHFPYSYSFRLPPLIAV